MGIEAFSLDYPQNNTIVDDNFTFGGTIFESAAQKELFIEYKNYWFILFICSIKLPIPELIQTR